MCEMVAYREMYKVSFTIDRNDRAQEFVLDLIESHTLNTRDNEEGEVITVEELTIQIQSIAE